MSDTTDTPKYRTTSCAQWVTSKGKDGRWIALSTTETADELNDLERQLAEANHQVEKYAAEAKSAIKENERLFSQLAEAREKADLWEKRAKERGKLAKELLLQRDRLADAIKRHKETLPMPPDYADGQLWEVLATLDRKEDA